MKKILALVMAAILIVFCMSACSKEQENIEGEESSVTNDKKIIETSTGTFEYGTNEDGEYEIIGYTPATVTIVDMELPSTIGEGIDIVGVATEAFKAENSIRSITIPTTYKYIGSYAFYDCDSLEKVTMSDSVTLIEEGAFQDCKVLSTVTFSKAITTIKERAFMNCPALLAVDLSGETTAIEDGAFFGCSELTTVTLSDKITTVFKSSFLNSPKVAFTVDGNGKYLGSTSNPHLALISIIDFDAKEITVNNSTKVIANGALSNCDRLENITLGAAVTVIDITCFENSPYIQYTVYENVRYLGTADNPHFVAVSVVLTAADTVTIHENTKVITNSAFLECTELNGIQYPKTTEEWKAIVKPDAWIEENGIVIDSLGDREKPEDQQ